jgi:hypothetical protein
VRDIDVQFGKHKERRHSQRVCVSVDVLILWGGATSQLASEETKTIIVNKRGVLVPLRKHVQLRDLLKVRNTATHEEVACRVVDLGTTDKLGVTGVGIEFVAPAPRFWRVAFPPED